MHLNMVQQWNRLSANIKSIVAGPPSPTPSLAFSIRFGGRFGGRILKMPQPELVDAMYKTSELSGLATLEYTLPAQPPTAPDSAVSTLPAMLAGSYCS